jgi:hypothetical protein
MGQTNNTNQWPHFQTSLWPHIRASSTSPAPTPETIPGFDINTGIKAELFTTPEAVAEVLSEVETQWINDGATPGNIEVAANEGMEDFARRIAAENRVKYGNALFQPNWQYGNAIKSYLDAMEYENMVTIEFYIRTSPAHGQQNPGDTVPYRMESTFTGSIVDHLEQPDTNQYGIIYNKALKDNSSQNTVGERLTFTDLSHGSGGLDRSTHSVNIGYIIDASGILKLTSTDYSLATHS